MKIMLADDDAGIRFTIEEIVRREGYDFCSAANGKETLELYRREQPNLLILDIMMPGMNGFDVCRQIREENPDFPIIFLSAKGDIVDKSIGFSLGADDYIVKPFDNQELLLRIAARLRRNRREYDFATWKTNRIRQNSSGEGSLIRKGDLLLDLESYEAFRGEERLDLTPKEFEILAFLAANAGKVFTREQILDFIWGSGNENDVNSITVFIRKIREKIEENPSRPRYIQTIWRVGYKFNEMN